MTTVPDFHIPLGVSSKVGFLVSAGLGVVSAVEAIANGDHTTAAISTLAGAVLVLFQTLGGRFAQAAALLRDVPPPQGSSQVVHEPLMGGTMGPQTKKPL